MGREVADALPAAGEMFDQANEILGYDLASLCFDGPEQQLHATENSQPALFLTSMAALTKLKHESPELVEGCPLTAGLSLGEYSALCFAGALSFEDGLKIVRLRGQAMQAAADASAGGMVAVLGLDAEKTAELCEQVRGDRVLQIANLLCPGNIVCSGDQSACDALAASAVEAGAMKCIPLTVAGAFHTSKMDPAVGKLKAALDDVELKIPRIPVVSNVDAKPHTDPDEIRQLLTQQVVSPVRWEASIGTMMEAGISEFYEIGAGKVLRGLMKRIGRKIPVTNV